MPTSPDLAKQTYSLHNDSGTASPQVQSTNVPSSDASKAVELQQQILDILTKMYKKMEGIQEEGVGVKHPHGTQPSRGPFKETKFGIPRQLPGQGQNLYLGYEDYEQIFPEDAYGEEVGPNARVFKVYNEEASVYDNDMIERSSDSSDVLLVFAGLFSAVLTTFVAQTSQALETDKATISNSLLLEIVQLQRVHEDGTPFGNVERAITETSPSGNALWVNGLWLTSLTLSLATALFAVLTKQWLRQYMVRLSGTIRDRSLIRQFRYAGMEKWHVVGIIGVLPILLHIALGVFLAGLVVFLIPRSLPLAYVIGGMTSIIYSLYFLSNLLPVLDIQCPYRTPFSEMLNIIFYQLRVAVLFIWASFACTVNTSRAYLLRALPHIPKGQALPVVAIPAFKSLRKQESSHVQQTSVTSSLLCGAIWWLRKVSVNPSVLSVAIQALGGLPPSQRELLLKTISNRSTAFCYFLQAQIRECLVADDEGKKVICRQDSTRRFERLACIWSFSVHSLQNWQQYRLIFLDMEDNERLPGLPHCPVSCDVEKEAFVICSLIRDPAEIKLSPCAWMSLFWNFTVGRKSKLIRKEAAFAICKGALADTTASAWDDALTPVSMSTALVGCPELILRIFRQFDPFQDESSNPSTPAPQSLRLRALLTLHHFLEITDSESLSPHDTETESRISLLCAVWSGIRSVMDQPTYRTLANVATIFDTTNVCLVDSPLLAGREPSEKSSGYCRSVLSCCYHAFSYAITEFGHDLTRSWKWKCSERVTDISLGLCGFDQNTHDIARDLLVLALKSDSQDVYSTFVNRDILATHRFDKHVLLVKAFVSGIARRRDADKWSLQSMDSQWPSSYIAYLHQPETLFHACQMLTIPQDATWENMLALARLDPDNVVWDTCRERLRKWRPTEDIQNFDFEISKDAQEARLQCALEVLDEFFACRRRRKEFVRRLNPLALFRGIRGCAEDVERQGSYAPEIAQPPSSRPMNRQRL